MADVKFFGMTLDFQFVRDCYNNANFTQFVFQPYMEDAEKWADSYFLLVYAMDSRGIVIEKRDLTVVENDTYQAFNRLELGNIELTRNQVKVFIDEDTAAGNTFTALYFSPVQFLEYAAYKVTGIKESFRSPSNAELEIKPSPPAPPAP